MRVAPALAGPIIVAAIMGFSVILTDNGVDDTTALDKKITAIVTADFAVR